jgi:epoxyqueuosine reductase
MDVFQPEKIKEICLQAGFDLVGFTHAKLPEKDRHYLEDWTRNGRYGKMEWFAKVQSQEIRLELRHLGFVPKSILCLGMVYRSQAGETMLEKMHQKISRYALGEDYHAVMRKKAKPVLSYLREQFPGYKFRQSVDSLPIPEKSFARLSGIGWMGKNTNIIHPELGSYFFISTILTDCDWGYNDAPAYDHCGSCRACLDACPTGALFSAYEIDASRCISHHNIENRDPVFDKEMNLFGWAYGCDICQEVCPWNNKKAKRNEIETQNKEFLPQGIFANHLFVELNEMDEVIFQESFGDTSIHRIGSRSWNRNLKQLKEQQDSLEK